MGEQRVSLAHGIERVTCVLRWTQLPDRSYRICLEGPLGAIDVTGRDLFTALQNVRRELEPNGWLIAVQGARKDTYPSGMMRDMLGGRRVYVLELGRHVQREHLVDIFAESDVQALGTVEEQDDFYRRWLARRSEMPPPS